MPVKITNDLYARKNFGFKIINFEKNLAKTQGVRFSLTTVMLDRVDLAW